MLPPHGEYMVAGLLYSLPTGGKGLMRLNSCFLFLFALPSAANGNRQLLYFTAGITGISIINLTKNNFS